jgi:P2-related tail formation protein
LEPVRHLDFPQESTPAERNLCQNAAADITISAFRNMLYSIPSVSAIPFIAVRTGGQGRKTPRCDLHD